MSRDEAVWEDPNGVPFLYDAKTKSWRTEGVGWTEYVKYARNPAGEYAWMWGNELGRQEWSRETDPVATSFEVTGIVRNCRFSLREGQRFGM